MADRINFELEHITAGKFIPVGKDDISFKQKLRTLGQAVSSNSSGIKLDILKDMTIDNVITPEEKKIIKSELDYIILGHATTENNVKELGIENSKEYVEYMKVYNELLDKIQPILADMESSSTVSEDFLDIFRTYSSYANALNNFIIATQNELQGNIRKIHLEVKQSTKSVGPGEVVSLTAYIYNGDSDITQLEMNKLNQSSVSNPYPTLFDWKFEGTKDDLTLANKWKGNRTVNLSFSDIKGTHLNASFESKLSL